MTIMIEPRFAEPILSGRKIHTIRQNYPYWAKHDGKECSIRVWEGKPYRSRQREICRKTIGVERCELIRSQPWSVNLCFEDTDYYMSHYLPYVARNDGLTLDEFYEYFKDYPEGDLAVLHFTDFRYGKRQDAL